MEVGSACAWLQWEDLLAVVHLQAAGDNCEEGAPVRTLWGTVVLPVIRTSFAGLNIVEKEKLSRGDLQHLLPGFIQMYQQIQSG